MTGQGNCRSIAKAIYKSDSIGSGYQIHLCCYHSQQVLVLRNRLEQKLDRILKRNENHPEAIFQHAEIDQAINNSNFKEHIFIVMATPVAEVGRDHDYDWAIVEPSSMRSIIQLAGRVWRHRPSKVAYEPNVSLMQFNINSLQNNNNVSAPVFVRPGFEDAINKLSTHDMKDLVPTDFLENINSNARIIKAKKLQPKNSLIDLEQKVMHDVMNNELNNYVNAYWENNKKSGKSLSYRSNTFLQVVSPFRQGRQRDQWVVLPVPNNEFVFYSKEQVMNNGLSNSSPYNMGFHYEELSHSNSFIRPWLNDSLNLAMDELQSICPNEDKNILAIKYAIVELEESEQGWCFNEKLGFWRNR